MDRVQGKVAVITGGASGIGLAAAKLLTGEGASVVIGDLRAQDAERAAREIVASGGRAVGVAVDVMEEASLKRLIDNAVTEFGRLDVMCNHVGGSNPRKDLDVMGLDLDEFDNVMRLNVRSTVLGCRLGPVS